MSTVFALILNFDLSLMEMSGVVEILYPITSDGGSADSSLKGYRQYYIILSIRIRLVMESDTSASNIPQ